MNSIVQPESQRSDRSFHSTVKQWKQLPFRNVRLRQQLYFRGIFPNRTAACIVAAFKKVHTTLCKAGFRPKMHKLDNECDVMLKDFFESEEISFQLVPPHNKRRNTAERAIRTFKNHLVAGLCSCDPNFPIHLCD